MEQLEILVENPDQPAFEQLSWAVKGQVRMLEGCRRQEARTLEGSSHPLELLGEVP